MYKPESKEQKQKKLVFLKPKVNLKGLMMPLTPQAIQEKQSEKCAVNMCKLYVIFYMRQKPEEHQ